MGNDLRRCFYFCRGAPANFLFDSKPNSKTGRAQDLGIMTYLQGFIFLAVAAFPSASKPLSLMSFINWA